MSRVGNKEIVIPNQVKVDYENGEVIVSGVKGKLSLVLNSRVKLDITNDIIKVVISNLDKKSRSIQGLTRSLIFNMILGVSEGFEKSLEVNGIGYKIELKDRSLVLNIGYSHPVIFELPEDIDAKVDKNVIKLFGISKEKVGQVASSIRQLRPPEPYKGKGIKYVSEYIHRKAGKSATK